MIYDCFQFFNELDLLKIRMEELDPIVDFFVITESNITFSGEKKPLYYFENKLLFEKFSHKIIHNIVLDTPEGNSVNPFDRDVFQKNARIRSLKNCTTNDIVILSDLDEIPSRKALIDILKNFDKNKIYHFAQRQFYFYFNLEEVSGKLLSYIGDYKYIKEKQWLGSCMFSYGLLNQMSLHEIRTNKSDQYSVRVNNGGWHFTYMGGNKENIVERVAHKIRSAAHQEFNNEKILSKLGSRINSKKDIFGRKSKFKQVKIDDTFPSFLLENKHLFGHLILKDKQSTYYDKFKSFLNRFRNYV